MFVDGSYFIWVCLFKIARYCNAYKGLEDGKELEVFAAEGVEAK